MKQTCAIIIDYTYGEDQLVRILEMGDLHQSKVSGLDLLRRKKGLSPLLEFYNNPVSGNGGTFYDGIRQTYPNAIYMLDCSEPELQSYRVRMYDFHSNSIADARFESKDVFHHLLHARALMGAKAEYKRPLVVSLTRSECSPALRIALTNLQKKQKNTFNILNYPRGVVYDACSDKVVFHRFISETKLCPDTLLIDIEHPNVTDIEEFLKQHPMPYYVIKPTRLSMGRGVQVLKKEELIPFIQGLFDILSVPIAEEKLDGRSYDLARYDMESQPFYWWKCVLAGGNPFLLLQTCCPSKMVDYEGQLFRPTARAVIEITFDDDTLPTLNCLGHYWKFPKTSAEHLSTESIVSHMEGTHPMAADISLEDLQTIEMQLQTHLPSVLLKLYRTDFGEALSQHFTASKALERYQQCVLAIDQISHESQALSSPLARLDNVSLANYFDDIVKVKYEELNQFKNEICYPSLDQVPVSTKHDCSSLFGFFSPPSPKNIKKKTTNRPEECSSCCTLL